MKEKDFAAGVRDCKFGIFDKWYRYNRKDGGVWYERGWQFQNADTMNERVQFI